MIDANTIAESVRTGRARAVDITIDAIDAATDSQGELNAFTLIDRGGALRQAEQIDDSIRAGMDPGPLAGVPIGLKDLIDQRDLPNTNGSGFAPVTPGRSAPVVRSLEAAGAVIIGRTGLHEWAFGFTSENAFHGAVRNPWDPSTSAGGSSGGSGAAVAARIVPMAIGTDTGGSVRVPAAMCGVFGLKVTHGRVPTSGVTPLAPSLDTVGPIATSAKDLALAYGSMVGHDPSDPWSRRTEVGDGPPLREKPTIGVVSQWMTAGAVTDAVLGSVERFAADAASAGFRVVEIDDPRLTAPPSVARAAGPEILRIHEQRLESDADRYSEETRLRLAQAREGTVDDVLDALAWGKGAENAMRDHWQEGVDVFVCPTVGHTRKEIGVPTMNIDGHDVFHREALAMFTAPINRIGAPAIAAPISDSGSPPVSIQLIGIPWAESAILDATMTLERVGILASPSPPKGGAPVPERNGLDDAPTQ